MYSCTHSFYSLTCFTNHIPRITHIYVHIPCIPRITIRPLFLLSPFRFLKSLLLQSHSSHSLRHDHIPHISYITITFLTFLSSRSHSSHSLRHDHIPHIPYVTITFLTFPTSRSHSSHSLCRDHIPHIP
jgi:hypothetical protein